MKTIASFAALLAAATLAAPPALAQEGPAPKSVAVGYADLDLGTSSGRQTFDSRIRQAIRTVCGTASPADLRGLNRVDSCREDLGARIASQRDVAVASARQSGATIAIRR